MKLLILALFGSASAFSLGMATSARAAVAPARADASPTMIFDQIFGAGKAKASHILVPDNGRANFIKGQIEAGEISFAAAAKEYSTCPSSSKGGDLGLFAPGAMVAQFNDYCFNPNSKVGELAVVRTQFGSHVIKLTKKP